MEEKLPITIYEKRNRESFFKVLFDGFCNIKTANYLAFQLAKRDISAQYRQSILGILWSLILPLSTALLWVFLKGSSTVKLAETGINYTLYVFVGTMSWAILTESILGPINSTLAMRKTLSKINFPKEALFVSSIYKTLFNTSTKMLILVVLLVYFGEPIGLNILWFPVALFAMFLLGTAIGLSITPFGLLYGDVGKMMTPTMQILMYVSPVVFAMPTQLDSLYNKVMYYNPLSPLINNFRNSLLSLPLEQTDYFFIIMGCSFLVFCVALVVFKITIPIITERISS